MFKAQLGHCQKTNKYFSATLLGHDVPINVSVELCWVKVKVIYLSKLLE